MFQLKKLKIKEFIKKKIVKPKHILEKIYNQWYLLTLAEHLKRTLICINNIITELDFAALKRYIKHKDCYKKIILIFFLTVFETYNKNETIFKGTQPPIDSGLAIYLVFFCSVNNMWLNFFLVNFHNCSFTYILLLLSVQLTLTHMVR